MRSAAKLLGKDEARRIAANIPGNFKQSVTRNRRIDKSVLTCRRGSTAWEEDYDNPQNSHTHHRATCRRDLAGNGAKRSRNGRRTASSWRR